MKRFLFSTMLLISMVSYSQTNVGVGTDDPKTTLDVNGELTVRKLDRANTKQDKYIVVGADGVLKVKQNNSAYPMNTIAGRFENGARKYITEPKRVGEIEFRIKADNGNLLMTDQVVVEMRFVNSSMPNQVGHVTGKRALADSWTQNSRVSSSDFSEVFRFNYELDYGGYANIIFEYGMCYRVDFHAWRYASSGWVPYNVTITELSGRGNW